MLPIVIYLFSWKVIFTKIISKCIGLIVGRISSDTSEDETYVSTSPPKVLLTGRLLLLSLFERRLLVHFLECSLLVALSARYKT